MMSVLPGRLAVKRAILVAVVVFGGLALLGLLAVVASRQWPFGSGTVAEGPTTRDVATVRVLLDGTANVEREIEYRGHLAERAAAEPAVVQARAVERLASYGARDISTEVERGGQIVRLRLRYMQDAAVGRRLDDYLVQYVQREPVPGRALFGVDYPLDSEAVRVARVILPGTILTFQHFTYQPLAPASFVVTSVRLENGSTVIVQSRQFVRSGDLVDPATVEQASVVPISFSTTYRPSLLRWFVVGLAVVGAVLQMRLVVPVTRLERANEPLPNGVFVRGLATLLVLLSVPLLVLTIQTAAVPDSLAVAIEQALFTFWPLASAQPLFLEDLAGAFGIGGTVLLACGIGLALQTRSARARAARLVVVACAGAAFAAIWWQLMIWLPLPSYIRYQLPVLFILGEIMLVVLALTIRQLTSFDMRRRFAGPDA